MPPLVLMKGIGTGRSSPDSRWRRFIIVTAVRKSDRSLIGAFLPDLFSNVFDISNIPQKMGSRSGLPVPIYLSIAMHFSSVQPILSCDANHDILDLVGNGREFHHNSFWYISSAHCGPQNALSVPQFCRAGWRGHPIAIDQHFDWIRCQPRDVHKCNRSLLDCTFGIVLHNSKNSTLPISRIIAFESSLNGL